MSDLQRLTKELLDAIPGVVSVEVEGESPQVLRVETLQPMDVELALAVLNTFAGEPQYLLPTPTTLVVWFE